MGKKKVIIAGGYKILIALYFIIKDKVAYNDLGEEYYQISKKTSLLNFIKKVKRAWARFEFETKVA
jgi:transposase